MKYAFIINPAAGQGEARSYWLSRIQKLAREQDIECELHNTLSFQEGVHYVRERCRQEEEIRFYGCGGDGTLNCLVSGVFGYSNAHVGVIPAGTGNDFVRNFTNSQGFTDLARQIGGTSRPVDVIRCTDAAGTRFSINMCNIGLDAAVADRAQEMKKKPFLKGPLAYGAAALAVLAGDIGFPVSLRFDDEPAREEEALLIAIGNGGFCGGGFYAAPCCSVNDGWMDVCFVKKTDKRRIASLIGKYRRGTHVTDPACQSILLYRKCRKLTVTPLDFDGRRPQRISVDGEGFDFRETTFEVIPRALNFILPQGCGFHRADGDGD